jgi:thioredoxin reductase (NADPH)
MTNSSTDLIIIGSGPAGYTAAIYAARAELRPVIFEGAQFGGALMTTTDVENFPGFPTGITGPELMKHMRDQAIRFGADIRTVDVDGIVLDSGAKTVTADNHEYDCRSVILAMGAASRYLRVPGEQAFIGRGVSVCATCDGFFFKNQHVAVVGGGDSAMEEATFLTKFADRVTIVHRRTSFRASAIMLERAKRNPKIRFLANTEVVEVHGDSSVTGITVRDVETGRSSALDIAGLFVAIGHAPRSQSIAGQVDLDDNGYVVVAAGSTATSVPGVFAAGDLVDHRYRQAITAAGTGCAAALDAERWLASQEQAVAPAGRTPN